MKRIRCFLCIFLTAVIACVFSSAAYAYDPYSFDTESKCSIHFSLIPNENKNDAIRGAEITIYRVADINISNNKFSYTYCGGFTDCGYDLDDPENHRLAWSLYTYAVENRLRGTSTVTDQNGEATFKDLKPGLYLGAETMGVKNYCDFSPFLLSLPMAENDRWIYNVSAAPKIEIERFVDITVSKYWKDNGVNRPESIQVQLVSDDGVYDTVTLSKNNNWSYTWELIEYDSSWTVKELNVPKGYTATYEQAGMDFSIFNTSDSNIITTPVNKVTTAPTATTAKIRTTASSHFTSVTSTGIVSTTGAGNTITTAGTGITGTSVNTTVTDDSSTLIQTGQLKWPVPVLICCGLVLITAGTAVIGCGGKSKNEDES